MFQRIRLESKYHAGVALLVGGVFVGSADAAVISGINFRGTQNPNRIEIQADGPIQVEKKVNAQDRQIVLEIPGASLDRSVSRNIDTSSFDSQVSLISPYQLEGDGGPNVRVVVQLRNNVDATLSLRENGASLSLSSDGQTNPDEAVPLKSLAATSSPAGEGEADAGSTLPTRPADAMDQALEASKSKKFSGKPITLQVRDVDVHDVFNLIAETSGFNIIVSDDVKGKLTLALVDVPWDQALDVVLQTLRLGADRRGNILRVMTLQGLTTEKQMELQAKKANEAVMPKITRVFPISYAKLDALKTTILELSNAEARSRAQAAGQGQAGASNAPIEGPISVVADERTNSLIVRGLPEYVDRAKKVIEILDTQTPQVLIEGKVVEASEGFSRSISGSIGAIQRQTFSGAGVSFNGGNPYGTLFGAGGTSSGEGTTGFNLTDGSANGFSTGYTMLTSGLRLNFTLQLAENENKIKIVSSPKAVVLNKQTATITQSFPAVIQVTTISNGVATTSFQQVEGTLGLNVTPTVTSDGSVLLQLTLNRDVVTQLSTSSATVAKRNINTNVLVESGSTLVLGGFYNNESQEAEGGIPFFRKIPIIGWLFGNKSKQEARSELLFFITPQILNPKKAGFASNGT